MGILNKSINFSTMPLLLPIFILLALISLPFEANAGIFDPATTDKSVEYLGTIFGNKVGNISFGEIPYSNQFLNNLFQIFNSIVLAVAVFILAYVSIISTINTAQEGQVMGKKWSSVWIPLRSTIGLLLLAPVPGSGYSSLQVVIMWIVLNGVGAADKMWDFVLNNLAQGISATQKHEINREDFTVLSQHGTALAKDLFNSLVCVAIINHNLPKTPGVVPEPDLGYHFETATDATPADLTKSSVLKFGSDPQKTPNQDKLNICGEMTITASLDNNDLPTPDSPQLLISDLDKVKIVDEIFRRKKQAIILMINEINHIALAIASSYNQTSQTVILSDIINYPGTLYKAVKYYQDAMANLNKQAAMSWVGINGMVDRQAISDSVIRQGKNFGWLTAGSYYYLLSQGSLKNLLSTAQEPLSMQQQLFSSKQINNTTKLANAAFAVTTSRIKSYITALDNNSQAIANLFNPPSELSIDGRLHKTKNRKTTTIKIPKKINQILKDTKAAALVPYVEKFFTLNESVLQDIQHRLSNNHDDPLLSQAIFGVNLMQMSETFWIGIITSPFISNNIAAKLSGSKDMSFLSVLITLLPPILVFAGIVWTVGATFAIYTPMVPYMMFLVTALGWFVLVIEAMVAAPLVGLGFIMPSQDELGKVAPALGIIANVFLRPILMVIGLLMAAKLYNTIINMVNMGFKFSFASLQSQTGTSMFAWIVMLVLYTSFIVTLVNKCYALIYQLPDKILRWIGVSGEQTDVSSVKETQQSFEQGATKGASAVEGPANAAAHMTKQNIQAAQAANKATKKPGATSIDS